jgi:sugar lactone lactonase YvrE
MRVPVELPAAVDAVVPVEALEVYAEGLDHPEGICLDPGGALYVSGEAGQLYRIGADRVATEILSTGGFLLGLAADGAGLIYACDLRHRCVWRIDPGNGSREVFTSGTPDEPMVTPNWGAFDAAGRFLVTDSGRWKAADGKIFVVDPGGATAVWSRESRDFPNGLAVAPDGACVYVLESTPGRLVSIELLDDGSAGPRHVLAELPGIVPDGVAMAADGSLLIACYRPDAIYRWEADQGLTVLASDPEGTLLAAPTNIVFAGPELDEILVPNIGRWHVTRVRAGIRGTRPFYPNIPL